MRKIIPVLVGVLLVWGCGGQTEPSCSPMKEIATSSVVKNGDTWDVAITSNIDAPVDKVLEAAQHPEAGHDLVPESILKSDLVGENGSTKTMDIVARLDILPPGFKVQTARVEYSFFPGEHRITSRSVDSKLADLTAEYKFDPTPDGKGTILHFTQQAKDKGQIPIEDVQKGALRELYITQVRAVNKAVGAAPAEAPQS